MSERTDIVIHSVRDSVTDCERQRQYKTVRKIVSVRVGSEGDIVSNSYSERPTDGQYQ